MKHTPRLILLDPNDNTLVCATPITAGDLLLIDGQHIAAPDTVEMAHKVARRALAVGEKVYKYGAPIGHVTVPTPPGAHVHLHNMVSDYLDHGELHHES